MKAILSRTLSRMSKPVEQVEEQMKQKGEAAQVEEQRIGNLKKKAVMNIEALRHGSSEKTVIGNDGEPPVILRQSANKKDFRHAKITVYLTALVDGNMLLFTDTFVFPQTKEIKSVLGFVVVQEKDDKLIESVDIHLYVFNTTTHKFMDEVLGIHEFVRQVKKLDLAKKSKAIEFDCFSSRKKKTGIMMKVSRM
jgi:hypothetical protein